MKTLHSVSLIICIMLLSLTSTALALDEQLVSWTENQTYPAISGSYVVFEDYWNSQYDVYLYDLVGKSTHTIYSGAGNQRFPDISGSIVVWQDDRSGNADIYGYDYNTGQEFPICTNSAPQSNPAISGHIVVWQDQRNATWDIYGYDLDTQQEIEIYVGGGSQTYPDVSVTADYPPTVVWQDNRDGNDEIYYKNLTTGYENNLTSNSGSQQRPTIDMPRVVWQDERNGNWDIYMFTFYSIYPGISVIENDPAEQQYPVISGKNIVWQDWRNGNGDIYGGRLGVLGTFQICVDSTSQAYPSVDGNYAVWHDYRNGATRAYDLFGGAFGADVWEVCSTTLDFEYVLQYAWPEWDKISNHFEGVTFSSARPTCPDDTVIIVDMTGTGGTHSGNLAIGNYGCEFIEGHLEMIFDDPQKIVTFYVGSHCGHYTINAYDAEVAGNLVFSEGFDLDCDLIDHGVHRFVQVESESKNIRRIEVDVDNDLHVYIDDLVFNIDDTPPVAVLQEPAFEECTCGIFPVIGQACDPEADWVDYVLSYQPIGAAPDDWTEISSNRGQVCGSGVLGEWDTGGMPHGRYILKLEVINECGMVSSDTTVAFVDKEFNTVTIRYPKDYDGNLGVIRGPAVCLDGTIWDYLCYDPALGYTTEYAPAASGSWQPMVPGPDGSSSVINDPYAHWDTTAVLDGDYDIRVTSEDKCGNVESDKITVRVDNTPPQAIIAEPDNCEFLSGPIVPISGIADDDNLHRWDMEFTGGPYNDWQPISMNNTLGVYKALLADWDISGLPPCSYTLRLRVWDKAILNCMSGDRGYAEETVSVKIGADLNGDGCVDLEDFALLASQWLEGC